MTIACVIRRTNAQTGFDTPTMAHDLIMTPDRDSAVARVPTWAPASHRVEFAGYSEVRPDLFQELVALGA